VVGRTVAAALGIALFLGAPYFLAEFQLFQVCLIAATAVVVLGLVVVTGLAGQVSLAQAAFVGLGGYGPAILATRYGLPLWAGIPLFAMCVGVIGFVLGQMALRVSGHYLALATMAFTAVVQLAFVHSDDVTGGAVGMPVPAFAVGGLVLATGRELYHVIVPVTALLFIGVINIMHSPIGRALTAIRQSETAASAIGINVRLLKACAFAASCMLGSFGGGMLASLSTYLDPAQYGITQTVYYLAVAVVGGLSSPLGAIIGSAVFVLIPEALQAFQSYLGLVFALLLLAFIVVRPDGLLSLAHLWPDALARHVRIGQWLRRCEHPRPDGAVRRDRGPGERLPGCLRRLHPGRDRAERRRQEHPHQRSHGPL
jgi:branched-chain amino acid transport system permease protein